jgi:large subunit ribosomal protein L29
MAVENERVPQLRSMNNEQLTTALSDLYEELFNLRFQVAAFKNPSPARFKQAKKAIARIKTIQHERELTSQAAGGKK